MSTKAIAVGLGTFFLLGPSLTTPAQGQVFPRSYREVPDDPPAPASRLKSRARTPAKQVTVGAFTSFQVNVDGAGLNILGDAANEPSIAVDPTNPLNMVIGWRQFDSVTSNFRQAGWGYSRDGGQTWTFPGVLEPGVFRSDPVLGVDSTGRFFFQSLEDDFTVDIWRSLDAGDTWLPPVEAAGGDKNWMNIDRTGGLGEGNIYESYSLSIRDGLCRPCVGDECCTDNLDSCCSGGECCFPTLCCDTGTFVRSTDGGASYEDPVSFTPDELFLGLIGSETIAIGPDGEVYVGGDGMDADNVPRLVVHRSDDAQDPSASPTFTASIVDVGVETAFQQPPNPDGGLGQVEMGVDTSGGPHHGNVYLLTSVLPPGGTSMDVVFYRSTDGGATWSSPVVVHDDDPVGDAWQWFGTMSVAPNGRIDVVWNDTRTSGVATVSETYYAYSYDAGVTWSENVAITPSWDSTLGWPNQNKIGDYYDMESDASGSALAYAATFNGEQDVYFTRVFPDCNGNARSDVDDIAAGARDANLNHIPDACETLDLSNPDPGLAGARNAWTVSDAVPGHRIRFLWSRAKGTSRVRGCPGLEVGLRNARKLGQRRVGSDGTATIRRRVPQRFSGIMVHFQAVDVKSCSFVSDVVSYRFP